MSEVTNPVGPSAGSLAVAGMNVVGTDQQIGNAERSHLDRKPISFQNSEDFNGGSRAMQQPSADGLNRPGSLRTPRWTEAFLGIVALIAWSCFFGAGVLVSTAPFRAILWGASVPSAAEWFRAAAVTFLCYTVTNLFFLSCLSSYLGCMASRWHTSPQSNALSDFYAEVRAPRLYMSAILRGFLLYLLVISGTLIVSNEDAMTGTTPAQFVRLAGLISSLGFIVGFDPQVIYRFLKKYTDLMNAPMRNATARPGGMSSERPPR